MIPISIKNVSMFYPNGTKALNNVSFDVMPGEDLVILGHNGSGKSTMFKCITGFERPTSGEIWIDDYNIVSNQNRKKMKQMRKQVGMVFQHFHLVNNLSVFQNVLFGSLGQEGTLRSLSPFAPKELRFKAMECLERVGLSHLARRRADELSGGQKQRVAIARVLLQDPKVILADEPIASLDPKAGREVMDLLWEVSRERGISIICVLHQLELAIEYGNRIIGMKGGEVYLDSRSERLSVDGLHFLYEDGKREPERLVLHG